MKDVVSYSIAVVNDALDCRNYGFHFPNNLDHINRSIKYFNTIYPYTLDGDNVLK